MNEPDLAIPAFQRLTLLDLILLVLAVGLGWAEFRAVTRMKGINDWDELPGLAWFNLIHYTLVAVAWVVVVRGACRCRRRLDLLAAGYVACIGVVITSTVLIVAALIAYRSRLGAAVTVQQFPIGQSIGQRLLFVSLDSHMFHGSVAGFLSSILTAGAVAILAGGWRRSPGTIELLGRAVAVGFLFQFCLFYWVE